MEPTLEQRAWLAGLYEGEGCADLRMRNEFGPYPSLAIQMTDLDVLEQVKEWFGVGNISGPYQSKNPKADGSLRKPQWKWAVYVGSDVATIIEYIRPWVKSRRGKKLDELLPVARLRTEQPYQRTEEHKAKMSEIKTGFTHSEETKRKMSEVAKARPKRSMPEEEKLKRSEVMKLSWQRRKSQ